MSEAARRKGVRLPWVADDAHADSVSATEPQIAEHPTKPAEADLAAGKSVAPVAEPAPSKAASPFLQSMVDAMRHIAEQARDDAVAALAASVEERATAMRSATELRAAELRSKADDDVARIAEQEQGEIQRIREEAAVLAEGRQRQLDVELASNAAAGEAALNAVASRVDGFEEQMAAFFNKLSDMHDPAAFAAAVKVMPSPPILDDVPTAPAAGASATPPDRPPWPAEPGMATVVAESTQVASGAEPADEEISTQILVTGLSSFGAITSFKQSLERAEGIRRVLMGLGTSGEFVFTATHAAGFDPTAAINTFEGDAQFTTEDGQLKVTVGASG